MRTRTLVAAAMLAIGALVGGWLTALDSRAPATGIHVFALAPAAATSAAAQPAAQGEAQLTGDWKLLNLGDAEAPKGEPITLSVTADGKVSGSTGVNRYFGALAKEKKLFGPLGMTRRAGPPEAMAAEAAFTKALAEATAFTIKEGKFSLLAGDKPRLVFERRQPAKE